MGNGEQLFCRASKKNELVAELTYWYKIDVGSLPKERQLGLLANLPRLQAQDRVFRGLYDPLDYQGVYELYLDAYGNDDLARAAQLASLKRVVRAETDAARG